jgi:hypothetical protein
MNYKNKSFSKDDLKYLSSALIVTVFLFTSIIPFAQVSAAAVTLTATVSTSLTFTTSSNQFGTIVPGTYSLATTTLSVATNDTSGWIVSLSGDDTATGINTMDLDADGSVEITDQTQWVPGSATTTAGNAAVRASLVNSGNVLAFRVMTASSSNGTPFISTSWWGATDVDGTAKYAGIASSTVQRTIGNAGSGSYSSTAHLNTVQYYLNVSSTQQTGAYSAPLTYTATGN